jgi:glycosyltransferase involved in cell wall biosynthesis
MKLLYIVPHINNEGGVARVLAIKANYLVENLGYEVHILTQNNGNSPLFYSFNDKIMLHDMVLRGSKLNFLWQYKKALYALSERINPDLIVVADNGLKGYLVPILLGKKTPIIFEMHGTKFIEEKENRNSLILKYVLSLKYKYKDFCVKKFDKVVFLSKESSLEWKVKNGVIISNPLWFSNDRNASLKAKKAIAVGRHSYEKGLDRLVLIWKKVVEIHPEWILTIYGKSKDNFSLKQLVEKLNIDNVIFCSPVENIDQKYLEASICLMTSRFEGFGMVLIEAMASGLPCVAYDCPCGPRSIINNNKNGFLIENGDEDSFVRAIGALIENENLRIEIGKEAKEDSNKYNVDAIVQTWHAFFSKILIDRNVLKKKQRNK